MAELRLSNYYFLFRDKQSRIHHRTHPYPVPPTSIRLFLRPSPLQQAWSARLPAQRLRCQCPLCPQLCGATKDHSGATARETRLWETEETAVEEEDDCWDETAVCMAWGAEGFLCVRYSSSLFSTIFFSCTLCNVYYTQTLTTNKNRWEPEFFYEGRKYSEEQQDKESPEAAQKPDTKQREAFKKQADALQGTNKQAWKPTWQVLGLNYDRTSIIKDAFKGSSSSTSSS